MAARHDRGSSRHEQAFSAGHQPPQRIVHRTQCCGWPYRSRRVHHRHALLYQGQGVSMVRRYLQASFVLLLLSTLLVPLNTFAKGGRGFSGGGRSFSGGSPTSGFSGGFSSSRSFSTPRSAPAPTRGTFKPSGGFTTRYDNNAASAQRAQSSKSLYEHANGVFNGSRTTTAQRVGPVSQETIETRPARQREVFSRYATQPV